MINLGYDWESAFRVCSAPRAANGYTGPTDVTYDQLASVVAKDERGGEYAEMDLVGLFETTDGRYVVIRAGCDTTGWECQAGGAIEVAASAEDAVRWSLTAEERERLQLPLLW